MMPKRSEISSVAWAGRALCVVALLSWCGVAAAQDVDVDVDVDAAPAPEAATLGATAAVVEDPFARYAFPEPGGWTHSFLTTAQIIYMPDFILDDFFARHPSHWDGRSNMAFGLEYVLRQVDVWEFRTSVLWANLGMPSTYWLETGKEADTADFTHFNLSVLSVEAAFFGTWDIIPQIGIFYGGGVWLGGMLGEVSKANILQDCVDTEVEDAPWREAYARCPTDGVFETETAVPPVVGMAIASAGVRFELAEHFVARLEGGFKGWFFGGLSIGGQFW